MKVLNKLVKKNLLLNKQRSIVSIVGIILSCALITAVFGLIMSFQETMINSSIENYGNRHVTFFDVDATDIEDINSHKNVDDYYLTKNEVSKLVNDDVEDFHYFGIVNLDEKAVLGLDHFIDKGRSPSNENEVVIDYYMADEFGIGIGDIIEVNVGNRYIDNTILEESDIYSEGEYFIGEDVREYKVVGISRYYIYYKSDYPYNMFTYNNEIMDNSNMHVLYNDLSNYDNITKSIIGIKTEEEIGKYEYYYNDEYLRWSGHLLNDSAREFLLVIGFIISFIIIGTSVFCIRNSFAISVNEKIRMYGMLASMGATPKQLKKNVLKEGFYLGLIGIPIGIILGIGVSYISVMLVNIYLESSLNDFIFEYSFSTLSILISIILAIITIYLSAIGSARRASKISEIDAIKNSGSIKKKNKKIKCPIIIRKLFKIGGVFAYKNMKRNKSKFRTTIISLVVSIATFISLSYFIQIGFDSVEHVYGDISFNVVVNYDSSNENIDLIYNDLANLPFVDEYAIHKYKLLDILPDQLDDSFTYDVNQFQPMVMLRSVGDEEYNRYIEELGYSYEDIYNKGILVYNSFSIKEDDGEVREINILDTSVNKLSLYTGDLLVGDIELIQSDILPMGGETFGGSFPVIVVNDEYLDSINSGERIDGIYINSSNARGYMNEINNYEDKNDILLSNILNMEELEDMQNNMVILMGIFLYGFIFVIILIGLTNIFNTLTTNMNLRSREFAILKSIGMTKVEFRNMIRLESIFYGVKSLFYGLIFGLILSYLIFYAFSNADIIDNEAINTFNIPYIPILISLVFVFLVINLIMRYSLSKINKQNIIETIRNENI